MNAGPNQEIGKNGLKCCNYHLDEKIIGIIYLEAAGGWSCKLFGDTAPRGRRHRMEKEMNVT